MKIAVTCENEQVFQHFGHTPGFAVFETEAGQIINEKRVSSGDSGHGALAG
ncbi:MAG: dinitrogenase iron-molybdenum cofactor biosynthesis protein, partial [Lentisphaeria bacterium]|nr:dinitrogenase iron-molybdenum cofactor biosynthesis protein [Lentisphaeria bacterium]